jgi:hypothetical protein
LTVLQGRCIVVLAVALHSILKEGGNDLPINMWVRTEWGSIGYDMQDASIRVGDRLLPPKALVEFPGAEGQPALTMELAVVRGVPQCRRVVIESHEGGRDVRTMDLRAVALNDWVEKLYALVATKIVEEKEGVVTATHSLAEPVVRESMKVIETARKQGRRKLDDPDFLRGVADVYRQNLDDRPVEAVQAAYGGKYRTAADYVQRARKAGLLPPTTPGKKKA